MKFADSRVSHASEWHCCCAGWGARVSTRARYRRLIWLRWGMASLNSGQNWADSVLSRIAIVDLSLHILYIYIYICIMMLDKSLKKIDNSKFGLLWNFLIMAIKNLLRWYDKRESKLFFYLEILYIFMYISRIYTNFKIRKFSDWIKISSWDNIQIFSNGRTLRLLFISLSKDKILSNRKFLRNNIRMYLSRISP